MWCIQIGGSEATQKERNCSRKQQKKLVENGVLKKINKKETGTKKKHDRMWGKQEKVKMEQQ